MEILNPGTKLLKEHHDKSKAFVSFRTNDVGLAFSKGAMQRFLLKRGMRLTFVIEIDRLYFFISKNEEGFLINAGRHEGGIISSRLLIRHIYLKLPSAKRNGSRYEIRLSPTQMNECITFEILLNQRLA